MKTAAIGIPTYRRPEQLRRLLLSIADINTPEGHNINLLIADNEGGSQEVKNCVEDHVSINGDKIPIEILDVANQGISFSRNALLENAFLRAEYDLLVMVDDDETISPDWLTELVRVQSKYSADFVGGLKVPMFAEQPQRWMTESHIYTYVPFDVEGPCSRLVSTDNLLITRDTFIRMGKPMFDPEFALTGGGDTEFLHRAKEAGAKFAFTDKAITYEHVPLKRMTWAWAKSRAFRIGVGLARISSLHSKSTVEKANFWLRLTAILVASSSVITIYFFSTNTRKKYQLFFIQQLGKIAGFSGTRVFPYAAKEE